MKKLVLLCLLAALAAIVYGQSSMSGGGTGGVGCTVSGSANQIVTNNGSTGCQSSAATVTTGGNISTTQAANGNDMFYGFRATDSSPTGNFIHFQNHAQNADLFIADISGNLKLGGSVTTGANGGIGGTITLPEGTAASASASNDVCYADSTAHAIKCSLNNGSFGLVPTAGAALVNKGVVIGGGGQAVSTIDFPDVKVIPAANCNNTTAGAGWSIGSGGTVGCRAGTNNLGGFATITDTSSTFAQFTLPIPVDWDSSTDPYILFAFQSATDTTNGHTVKPQIEVSCPTATNGTVSDDATFSAAQTVATVTFGASAVAHGFYTGSGQIGSTQMSGCVAGGMMIVQVGRATDTATGNINFYYANVTFPRLLAVQAN